uniref:Transposase n=1 Tax=Panagrellus redivivus TaxID=6233 RepID=A0A7E4VWR4_PANRE
MEIRFFEKTLTVFVDAKEVATFDHRALPTYGEMSFEGLLHIRGITICEPQQWPKHAGDMYSGQLTKQTYSYSKDDS